MSQTETSQAEKSEVDVIELMIRAWEGRTLIIFTMVICLASSLAWHLVVPNRFTANITVAATAKWPYYEVEQFLSFFNEKMESQQSESPITSETMLKSFVSYFNQRDALKAAIVKHHESFKDGQLQSDELLGSIALNYQLLPKRKSKEYMLTFTTMNPTTSNQILKTTFNSIHRIVRDDIKKALIAFNGTYLLNQKLEQEMLQASIKQRTSQVVNIHDLKIQELKGQIALARHMDISSGPLFSDNQNLVFSTEELMQLGTFPRYLQGYKILEEELRILQSTSIETLIEGDEEILALKQRLNVLQAMEGISSYDTTLQNLAVMQDYFVPIDVNLIDISYTRQRSGLQLFAATGFLGFTIGTILTLLYQAIKVRLKSRNEAAD